MHQKIALFSLAAAAVKAQQVGTLTAETHPQLSTQQCTASGCTTSQNSIVLDANWRWVHSTSGSTNCYTGNTWDATLCPDDTTCAANCALDGADYSGTYGISTSGNALTLKLKTGSNVGSRVYLLNSAGSAYEMFDLKNQEFTFDVDVSQLPCGLNGALYFVNMDSDGGMARFPGNKAGAKYGTGYCDSQCPRDLKFIDGEANVEGWTPASNNANTGTGAMGTCCPEMDIWEANSISAAVTPHPCTVLEQTSCDADSNCGGTGSTGSARYASLCDPDGCDYNSYRMGNTTFYGPGETVNTNSKFTVVTQFITSDGTANGDLTEIRRIYVQNGKTIQQSKVNVAGVTGGNQDNSITEAFCDSQKKVFGDTTSFEDNGGLTAMGNAFAKGQVLVMSLWDDYAANMLWLDSDYPTTSPATSPGVARGTCSTSSGVPATVESQNGNSQVIFSNIKFGTLNSTYTQ